MTLPRHVLGLLIMSVAAPASGAPGAAEPGATTDGPASARPAVREIVDGPDVDGPVRLSLPTAADRTAWQRSGFRLGVGLLYGRFQGVMPGSGMFGLAIRPGLRLDRDWSIYLPLQYAAVSHGLRYVAAVEPTWHITPYLAVAAGIGYGGLVSASSQVDPPPFNFDELNQSYTYLNTRTPLSECTGVGVAANGRVELGYVLGARTRTSVALELFRQWTGCEQGIGVVDPYTGVEAVHRQFWASTGLTLSWGLEWR